MSANFVACHCSTSRRMAEVAQAAASFQPEKAAIRTGARSSGRSESRTCSIGGMVAQGGAPGGLRREAGLARQQERREGGADEAVGLLAFFAAWGRPEGPPHCPDDGLEVERLGDE